jgi:hypothetical protein
MSERMTERMTEREIVFGSLAAAPLAAAAVVAVLSGRAPLTLSVLAFVVLAAGVVLLPRRGLAVARTWVVGYLVLQFPVRVFFLLSGPVEPPPIYAAYAPGSGLEGMLTTAMIQVDVALAVLGAAYAVTSLRTRRSPDVGDVRIDNGRFAALFGLALALLFLEVRMFSGHTTGGGDFAFALPGLAAAGASAVVCYAFARRPAEHAVLFVAALAYNAARVVLLSSKLSLLASVLALIIGFSTRSRADRPAGAGAWRTLRSALVAVVMVLVASYAFAAAVPTAERGAVGPAVAQGATNAVSRSYGVDALLAVNGYVDRGGPLQMGASIAGLAWSWVPRQLWPDKPKSFSVQFGEEVFSFSSIAGESYFAPGYFGEWVMNWGTLGLLAGAIVFGAGLALVDAMASVPRRVLWIIVMVHLVEGSLVAQFWLAAPFLVGGYWILGGAGSIKADTGRDQSRRLLNSTG